MGIPSVGIIAFPQIDSFLFSIPYDVFRMRLQQKLFDVRVATVDDQPALMDEALCIRPTIGMAEIGHSDILVIAGWPGVSHTPEQQITEALRRAAKRGALIAGLCFGAYALAYAGLLDGKEATTHWLAEDDFKKRFPGVRLNSNLLYVESGNIITSAGAAAGIDCCIYVINKFYGCSIANEAARKMVSSPYRAGGQAQFVSYAEIRPHEAGINAITEFLNVNIRNDYTLNELAQKFCMSRRTLIRRFEKACGMSVKKWVANLRLKRSCELLESTDWSIEKIAGEAGFGSAGLLRHHFGRKYGITPQSWRERFFNGRGEKAAI